MSIAQSLPKVHPLFMQVCPICGQNNRVIVKGVSNYGGKQEIHPDIGFSFCNCKAIFYTSFENVKEHIGPQSEADPIGFLKREYEIMPSGSVIQIIMPDPFFCEWGMDPYAFQHWNPRTTHIIWDMDSYVEECRAVGFNVMKHGRIMDVQTKTPKCFEVVLRRP